MTILITIILTSAFWIFLFIIAVRKGKRTLNRALDLQAEHHKQLVQDVESMRIINEIDQYDQEHPEPKN